MAKGGDPTRRHVLPTITATSIIVNALSCRGEFIQLNITYLSFQPHFQPNQDSPFLLNDLVYALESTKPASYACPFPHRTHGSPHHQRRAKECPVRRDKDQRKNTLYRGFTKVQQLHYKSATRPELPHSIQFACC